LINSNTNAAKIYLHFVICSIRQCVTN
jgi:hypothetical protein